MASSAKSRAPIARSRVPFLLARRRPPPSMDKPLRSTPRATPRATCLLVRPRLLLFIRPRPPPIKRYIARARATTRQAAGATPRRTVPTGTRQSRSHTQCPKPAVTMRPVQTHPRRSPRMPTRRTTTRRPATKPPAPARAAALPQERFRRTRQCTRCLTRLMYLRASRPTRKRLMTMTLKTIRGLKQASPAMKAASSKGRVLTNQKLPRRVRHPTREQVNRPHRASRQQLQKQEHDRMAIHPVMGTSLRRMAPTTQRTPTTVGTAKPSAARMALPAKPATTKLATGTEMTAVTTTAIRAARLRSTRSTSRRMATTMRMLKSTSVTTTRSST
mmetsp:Transcript_40390/g.111308  ORF Transcript_40390/g.111308 Transcript_40390/m.111308 type:complete len:331 (+) Transcript_40390:793-1785(+)